MKEQKISKSRVEGIKTSEIFALCVYFCIMFLLTVASIYANVVDVVDSKCFVLNFSKEYTIYICAGLISSITLLFIAPRRIKQAQINNIHEITKTILDKKYVVTSLKQEKSNISKVKIYNTTLYEYEAMFNEVYSFYNKQVDYINEISYFLKSKCVAIYCPKMKENVFVIDEEISNEFYEKFHNYKKTFETLKIITEVTLKPFITETSKLYFNDKQMLTMDGLVIMIINENIQKVINNISNGHDFKENKFRVLFRDYYKNGELLTISDEEDYLL